MKNYLEKLLHNRPVALATGTVVVGLSFYLFSRSVGMSAVFKNLLSADAVWLLLIIGAQSIAFWAYIIPYKHMFKLSYKDAAVHSFEGFHPTLGGGVSYDLKTHLGQRARVYYLGLWEYAVLAPAVLIAAIYGLINGGVPSPLSLPWIIGVPTGFALFGIVLFFRHRIANHFPKTKRILNFMAGLIKQQNVKGVLFLMGGMLLYWTGELFSLWGALRLFDVHLSWFALLLAYATGYVISRRSLPLGGAGILLVALALSLYWVGAALSVTLLVALAYQVFNLITPAVYRKLVTAFSTQA